MNQQLSRLSIGAMAGALATLPMSVAMLVGQRLMPWTRREALPPAIIAYEAAKTVGLHDDLDREEHVALTTVAHFGYGAAMGAIYGVAGPPRSPVAAATSGVAFGLGVWSGSYLGLLPATGLYRSAARDSAERNALMIGAHIVWGASLGLIAHRMMHRTSARRERVSRPREATVSERT